MPTKIAAVSDDGQTISQHFGRANYYVVLTIEDGKIIAREQRAKPSHTHGAGGHHHEPQQLGEPTQHGASPAEQNLHGRMAEPVKDCQIVLARGMGTGAYVSLEQAGLQPIITTVASIDEAALAAAQGTLVNHEEKLH